MKTSLALIGLGLLSSSLVAQAATYTTFGSGCPSGNGHIVPLTGVSAWGNSANAWTLGTNNQRWQQEVDASQMPTTGKPFFNIGFREDNANRSNGAHVLQLKILVGMTTYSSATLTGTFATNATGAQTTVFDGKMSLPAVPGGNQNLKKFDYVAKFSKPYVYVPIKGQNFLIEIVNTTPTYVRRYPDCFSGAGTPGSRVYASGNPTAASGTLGKNHLMVMSFGTTNATAPVLSATGTPAMGKTFSVDLSSANGNTAAGLIFGVSKTVWGAAKLPFDLGGAGGPGCSLLVSFDALLALPVISGAGSVKFGVPNNRALLGTSFHNQFFAVDRSANSLGLSFTNAGTGKIGS
jgi:hypothetical protein